MNRRRTALTTALLLTATALGTGAAAPTSARTLPKAGNEQWWFKALAIEDVWATGARGQGITVAVIDDGVDASRPELKGRVLPGLGYKGSDPHVNTTKRGHGTAMSVFIAGQGGTWAGAGVAPDAMILPITNGPGADGLEDQIRYAVDHGADIINMSIAVHDACDSPANPGLPEAVRYAVDHNVLLFAGSGNDGDHRDNLPADCPGVVSVTAVDNNAHVWSDSTTNGSVALAAPGADMASRTTARTRGFGSGTSDATAIASGSAALVWSKYPNLTNRQILARLLYTAKDIGPKGRDDSSGFGVALPYEAIVDDVPADAPNPIFDELARTATTPAPTPAFTLPPADNGPISETVLIRLGLGALLLTAIGGVIAFVRARRRPCGANDSQPGRRPGPGGF